jgi:hypothetical protein
MMNQFELAFYSKDIKNMEKYYVPSSRDNYFIDIALDEGNKDVYNFFANRNVKPSLFANQMARINGYNQLASEVESYTDFRNKVSVKDIYYKYDRTNKSMRWNPYVPNEFRF